MSLNYEKLAECEAMLQEEFKDCVKSHDSMGASDMRYALRHISQRVAEELKVLRLRENGLARVKDIVNN